MRRVTSIDSVVLDHTCFISTEFVIANYIGTRSITIDGSSSIFTQLKGENTLEAQITSKGSGWVSRATKNKLMASVNIDNIVVEFNDASSETYTYDHTKIPMKFTPLYEGADWFSVEINLRKV